MKKQICSETSIAEQLREFLEREKVDIGFVTGQEGDVEVVKGDNRKEGNLNIIYSGGRITCETALALAEKLQISARQMGKLLNYLDVKICSCSLGCFK